MRNGIPLLNAIDGLIEQLKGEGRVVDAPRTRSSKKLSDLQLPRA